MGKLAYAFPQISCFGLCSEIFLIYYLYNFTRRETRFSSAYDLLAGFFFQSNTCL